MIRDEVDLEWEPGQPPRSKRYGDIYFSRDDGLAEARAVFLEGCHLPAAWQGRQRFTVAELGFGTGLNILALLDLWRRERPPGARLHIFSVEADLLTGGQAERAFAAWPELGDLAADLLARWPRRTRGFHRIDFPTVNAQLDVAVMDVEHALSSWSGRADAWFLDGFSPALNPAMWSPEVLRAVADHSAPGARLATYTVAKAVRDGLASSGFTVERLPGFGRKRERLEGAFGGASFVQPSPSLRVAIIGGGVAGAALFRAFASEGLASTVFAVSGPTPSGGPAALVAPRLDAGMGDVAALFSQAFHRAIDLYNEVPSALIATGALQLAVDERASNRLLRVAEGDLFDPSMMRPKTAEETASALGEPAPEGLMFEDAVVVEPERLLSAWMPRVSEARVVSLRRDNDALRLLDADGVCLGEADIVVVAAGLASQRLIPSLSLRPVRGQASCAVDHAPAMATLFGGYTIPTREGVMFGATHDRDDEKTDTRTLDHERNLASLRATLPEAAAQLSNAVLTAHVGIRAATPDFLPVAGAIADEPGLYVLTGLGSRGYCLAPLLAEHIAALVTGSPSPLPRHMSDLVDPGRFARRAAKRRPRAG